MQRFYTTIALVMTTILCILPKAQAMIVFDPTNYAQNLKTAIQTAATLNQLRSAYETQLQQFHTLQSQFHTITDHYELFELSLRKLEDLKQLLANTEDAIYTTTGNSDFSLLPTLNPNTPNYTQKRDAILSEYYHIPQNPSRIAERFTGLLHDSDIETLTANAEQNQKHYERFLDSVETREHQQQTQQQRIDHIQSYQDTLNHLGDNSELKTAQTTASELHLSLQQNEAILASLQSIQQAQSLILAQQISNQSEDEENEQKRLLRAIQQDDSSYGQSKWGDL